MAGQLLVAQPRGCGARLSGGLRFRRIWGQREPARMADQEGSAHAASAVRNLAALAVVGVAMRCAAGCVCVRAHRRPPEGRLAIVAAVASGVKLAVTAGEVAGGVSQGAAPPPAAAPPAEA